MATAGLRMGELIMSFPISVDGQRMGQSYNIEAGLRNHEYVPISLITSCMLCMCVSVLTHLRV